jgi:hypothetical protein
LVIARIICVENGAARINAGVGATSDVFIHL